MLVLPKLKLSKYDTIVAVDHVFAGLSHTPLEIDLLPTSTPRVGCVIVPASCLVWSARQSASSNFSAESTGVFHCEPVGRAVFKADIGIENTPPDPEEYEHPGNREVSVTIVFCKRHIFY